jgi:hypothetical protein
MAYADPPDIPGQNADSPFGVPLPVGAS